MKKVGIVTITGGANYGNRLQNYALQTVVEHLGFSAETIDYKPHYPKHEEECGKLWGKIREWKSVGISGSLWDMERLLRKRISQRAHPALFNDKIENFEAFNRKYIHMANRPFCCTDNLDSLDGWYYAFITGSDQVWNPYWEGADPFYFLPFADRNKRIAYAPSFGVSEIPSNLKDIYRSRLGEIPYLSVREDQGREIIRSLIGRDVPVLPDPTLLLNAEEWLQLTDKRSIYPEGKYLLAYFLGKPDYQYHRAIIRYAGKYGLKIRTLNDLMYPALYAADPTVFLNLVAHAGLVCTDSFHASVFSIIFNRPFVVFARNGCSKKEAMSSRIITLLGSFQLTDRMFRREIESDDFLHADFRIANRRISEQKSVAFHFLNQALKEIESHRSEL